MPSTMAPLMHPFASAAGAAATPSAATMESPRMNFFTAATPNVRMGGKHVRSDFKTSEGETAFQVFERHHDMLAIRRARSEAFIPGFDMRQVRTVNLEFEVAVQLRAGGDVAEGEGIARNKGAAGHVRVEQAEQDGAARDTLPDQRPIALLFRRAVEIPEHATDEGRLEIGGDPVGPLVRGRADGRIGWPKRTVAVFRREIANDGVALPHPGAAVVDNRHAP